MTIDMDMTRIGERILTEREFNKEYLSEWRTSKIKILCLTINYPLAMSSYFISTMRRMPNIDLKVTGPFTGSWIPWMGGMNLPDKYVKSVEIPLPFPPNIGEVNYELVKAQFPVGWIPDIVLTIDAGIHWKYKPTDGIVCHVATDPHCVSGDTLLATGNGILYAHEASINTKLIANKFNTGVCTGVVGTKAIFQLEK